MALDLRYSQTNLTSPVGNPTQIVGFVPCDNNTVAAGGPTAFNQLTTQSNGAGGNASVYDVQISPGAPVQNDNRLGGPNPNAVPTTAQAGIGNGVPDGDSANSTAQGGGPSATSTGLFTTQGAMSRGQLGGGQSETALAAN